ncbi:MAG: flagellar biosynthetic protein FliO [Fimbriimonadaceae bacterium]
MNRFTLTISGILAPAFLLAQKTTTDLGTKGDLIKPEATAQATGPNIGFTQFLPMLVALAIIFILLKFVAPKMIGKFNKRLTTTLNSPIILEETASFATGNLQVVTVRGKSLLLAITPQGVTCLSEVPNKAPEDPTPAFFELLDRQSVEPKPQRIVTHAVVEEATEEKPKAHPATKAYTSQTKAETKQPSREELIARLQQLSSK